MTKPEIACVVTVTGIVMFISNFKVLQRFPTFVLCKRCLSLSRASFLKSSPGKTVSGFGSKYRKNLPVLDAATDSSRKKKFKEKKPSLGTSYQRGIQIMASTIVVPDSSESKVKSQYYDFFLVLDFEATCEEDQKIVPQVLRQQHFIFKLYLFYHCKCYNSSTKLVHISTNGSVSMVDLPV